MVLRVLMISLDPAAAAVKGKHIGNLQQRLVEYGRHLDYLYCVVYTPRDNTLYKHQRLSGNVEVFPSLSRNVVLFAWDAYRIASEICSREDIDIVTTQDPIFCGIAGLALRYRYGKPLLVQVHGDSLDNKYWLRERKIRYLLNVIGKFVLKRADAVRVVSERVKKRVMNMGIEEERIFKLPIYIDVKKFSEAKGGEEIRQKFKGYDNIVLFVGRLAREKNIPNLLRAARIVVEKFPRTLFLIVGDGPEREKLERLAKELKVADNVVFEGVVEHDLLPAYYKACDIFVLPSDHEGWGLVIVEALAAGKPVITTDVGLVGEIVEDGKYGFVVPKGDEKILANKIIMLIKNHSLRDKMGRNGREIVLKTQDLQISGKKQKEIYQKVLEISRK
jgi:glycosyltransferase involved in cell wall biosynthesis